MKTLKRIILYAFVTLFVILAGFKVVTYHQYTVPILMYHNVEELDRHEANWVNPANFRRQLTFINKHGYNVVSLDELVAATEAAQCLPRNSVVLTFDDGYVNNYIHVFPILQEFDFPAIIFVPTDKIGQPGYLTWAQIQEMADAGVSFGSHGLMGNYLPDMRLERQKEEIVKSRAMLTGHLKRDVDFIAYPIGGFSDAIKQMVKQAGYRAAVATNRGYDRFNKDVFQLNRIRLSNKDDNPIVLWVKLSGYYNYFRKYKDPH